MTASEDFAGAERLSVWLELRRRYLQKRYIVTWILAAILPFMLLRLLFLSENAFPFQSVAVSSPSISVQAGGNISQGQSPIFARVPAPAPGLEDVNSSKTTIPESPPLIRPDEDAWTSHDDWINHNLSRPDDVNFKPTGVQNLTEVMKDFLHESANGEDFGLPEDNEKGVLQFEATEAPNNTVNETKENRFGEERGPDEEEIEEKHVQQQKECNDGGKKVEHEFERQVQRNEETSQQDNQVQAKCKDEEEDQAETKDEAMEGVEQVDTAEGRPQQSSSKTQEETPAEGQCDLFEGEWEHDPEGPLYTNSTCLYMQRDQNCLSNGRPDTDYLYWRWKPRGCDLPRFDAKSFLDKFRGKALGFIGDSIARNQMESFLCLLSQVEKPTRTNVTEDYKTVWWLYEEHQVTLAVIWSPYLLKNSEQGDMGFEKGQSIVYLDVLDPAWTSVMQDFDVMVFLTGHWYYKESVYIEHEKVIGCHYCPGLNLTDVTIYRAYRAGIRQVLEKVSEEYKGVVFMNTLPLSHFENGSWDSGGYCKREVPLQPLESRQFPGDHSNLHDIFMEEFNIVIKKNRGLPNTRIEILDVTKVTLQRADGHPGPFRRPHPYEGWDPNVYYPNDCLHWCLPGPVDAWNQLLVKIFEKYF